MWTPFYPKEWIFNMRFIAKMTLHAHTVDRQTLMHRTMKSFFLTVLHDQYYLKVFSSNFHYLIQHLGMRRGSKQSNESKLGGKNDQMLVPQYKVSDWGVCQGRKPFHLWQRNCFALFPKCMLVILIMQSFAHILTGIIFMNILLFFLLNSVDNPIYVFWLKGASIPSLDRKWFQNNGIL